MCLIGSNTVNTIYVAVERLANVTSSIFHKYSIGLLLVFTVIKFKNRGLELLDKNICIVRLRYIVLSLEF